MDAIHAAGHGHSYLAVTRQGLAAITRTRGNEDCFMILCGFPPIKANFDINISGNTQTNYDAKAIDACRTAMAKGKGLHKGVVVDCFQGIQKWIIKINPSWQRILLLKSLLANDLFVESYLRAISMKAGNRL